MAKNAAGSEDAAASSKPGELPVCGAAIGDQQNTSPASKNQALCILGIDPGLSGAIAFYFPCQPDRVAVEDMPTVAGAIDCATLARRIRQMAPNVVVVERVGAMPKQGVSSTFKFGASYGAVLGILAALQIRTVLMTPSVWKKHFRLDSDKEKSRALALRTFSKTPEHFARKKDHGRAEAALMAAWYSQYTDGLK